MRPLLCSSIVLLLVCADADGQSLGDVARQEEARRKTVAASSRVYTNQDLPETSPQSVAPPPVAATPSTPEPGKTPAETKPSEAAADSTATSKRPPNQHRDEKHWRGRAQDYRNRLTNLRNIVASFETRLETLRAVPQTPVIASEIRLAEKDLLKFRNDLQSLEKEWARVEKQAQEAGASDWIRE